MCNPIEGQKRRYEHSLQRLCPPGWVPGNKKPLRPFAGVPSELTRHDAIGITSKIASTIALSFDFEPLT